MGTVANRSADTRCYTMNERKFMLRVKGCERRFYRIAFLMLKSDMPLPDQARGKGEWALACKAYAASSLYYVDQYGQYECAQAREEREIAFTILRNAEAAVVRKATGKFVDYVARGTLTLSAASTRATVTLSDATRGDGCGKGQAGGILHYHLFVDGQKLPDEQGTVSESDRWEAVGSYSTTFAALPGEAK